MLQGGSHVSRGQIRSLCGGACRVSRWPERSHKKGKKKDNIESLGRLWLRCQFVMYTPVDSICYNNYLIGTSPYSKFIKQPFYRS